MRSGHQAKHDRPNAGRAKSASAFLFDLDGTFSLAEVRAPLGTHDQR
jgi:hypothetical protein